MYKIMSEIFPDIMIAVDGCSSTGKSSLAKAIARRLGFMYLDSGALYRGVTLFARREGLISAMDVVRPELEDRLRGLDLHFDAENRLYEGNTCIEDEIRGMEVSSQVSPIAAVPYVREWVDTRLHLLASKRRAVMDGRDIGTTVFPDAEIKIFLTADEKVRARRRYDELVAKGQPATLEDVELNLRHRDYIDSHRETSPLRRAEDAYILDNSNLDIPQEVEWVVGLIQGKFAIYGDWKG